MRMTEMVPTAPLQIEKSTRRDRGRVLTSGDAGKILPLKYIPMLREDAVRRGRVRINLEMMETAEMLMNGINVHVYAHVVPMLAFDRFNGSMEELNRSYQKENGIGGSLVPYFNTISSAAALDTTSGDAATFLQTMGIHTQSDTMNSTIIEAYNCIVNYRRKARSEALTQRTALDWTLAEAFWGMENSHIVPNYSQKTIDGEVLLRGLDFQLPVRAKKLIAGPYVKDASNNDALASSSYYAPTALGADWTDQGDYYETAIGDIWAEAASANVTMSLADIELAKQTAAFAKLRSMYDGIDDDHVIDLLMEGIRVPEETMKQPILIGKQSAMIGYNQRYATDGANLAQSVTNGFATIDMTLRTPQMNTGAVILITAEIVPQQMFERKKDYYLYETDPDNLPNYMRDYLDPEKVAVVKNDHLDVNHSTPDGTFGYAPLNHEYMRDMVNVGGKYYRPADDAFDEDRAKIWTAETTDPTLSDDFYLVSNLHKKVFADQNADSFEITCLSDVEISGNTVFGDALLEADADTDYDRIADLVDTGRIEK